MGLDLTPLGRPKSGHEAEWQKLMKTAYAGKKESKRAFKRRNQISIAPWAAIGAPRVGYDKKADAWALKNWRRKAGMSDTALLKYLHGHYVLELLKGKCVGLPKYTHAGLYGGLDETSFRGSFLTFCEDLLGEDLLNQAWTNVMRPEEAVAYGKTLLALVEKTKLHGSRRTSKLRSDSGAKKSKAGEQEMTISEKLDILRAAGRWYVFWGELGHPIEAWF